ncbi:unnamed protein product [Allacma fusca]|uniref:Uncharacterized protein n=1 Tax=Allacma fusca TaxID=39272 RepID=A0A8J2JNX2_9HEXA|nr:unnamed protein product [Allacma fusca]
MMIDTMRPIHRWTAESASSLSLNLLHSSVDGSTLLSTSFYFIFHLEYPHSIGINNGLTSTLGKNNTRLSSVIENVRRFNNVHDQSDILMERF